MKKRILLWITSAAVAIAMAIPSMSFGAVTGSDTPSDVNMGKTKWEIKISTNYMKAPTPPYIQGGYIYVAAGNYAYKLNKSTGKILKKSKGLKNKVGFATVAMSGNGKDTVYVPEGNGVIQALNSNDLSIRWTSSEYAGIGGQSINPVTYNSGKVYFGTWNGTDKKASYVCLDSKNGKKIWNQENSGGFYWAGAYVRDDNIIFGSEDGTLYSKKTGGAAVDTVKASGSIRSTVVCDGSNVYFTTTKGRLYKVAVDASGNLGKVSYYQMGNRSVNTPVIYKNKVYVGTDGSKVMAIDTATMSRIWEKSVPGAVKGEMLLSTGHQGKLCLYMTYNKLPGGIYYLELDAEGKTVKKAGDLSIPSNKQYCASPIMSDNSGILYYKNDNGYIMAIKSGYRAGGKPVIKTAKAEGYNKIKITWKKQKGATGYAVYRAKNKKGTYGRIGKTAGAKNQYINKKVKTNKRYYYKIRALYAGTGNNVLSTSFSAIRSAKAVPAAPSLKTKAGKGSVKLSWKKVAGATGYNIYRATKKSGKYKKIKTIKRGKVTNFTNKKLRKGKKYYYKVRAYMKVGGKKVYGIFSKTSYKKVK